MMVPTATRATTPRAAPRPMVAPLNEDESSPDGVCVTTTVSVTFDATTLLCVGMVKEESVSQQRRLLLPQQYVPSPQGVISTVPFCDPLL